MMSKLILAVAFSIGLLAGCHTATAPEADLAAARARWARSGLQNYSITISRSCKCTPEMTGPVVVEVRNHTVVSRHYPTSGDTVGTGLAPEFPSVEELFARIEAAVDRRAASIDARYDPHLGYPTRVAIDYNARMADDEIVFTVLDLRRR